MLMCLASVFVFIYCFSFNFTTIISFTLFQVIHTEAYVGKPKVKSAAAACLSYVAL